MTEAKPARERVKCARPGCHVTFIPRTKVNIYCSTLCKGRVAPFKHVLNLPARGQ